MNREDLLARLGEIFRAHGYEGASLALIGAATGLGKGSLYHAFPGGKAEMAAAVLADIDAWFRVHVFAPLREAADPGAAIRAMLDACDTYFRSGRRVCLIGALALADTRDRFAAALSGYFAEWIAALTDALVRAGRARVEAAMLAEETVAAIQGALVLCRATGEPALFARAIARLHRRLGLN